MDERPASKLQPLLVRADRRSLKDYSYYQSLFASANVKMLLKELKGTFKSASAEKPKKNASFGSLDFKISMIRAAQMKAEITAQKKMYKAMKRAMPSKEVTYKTQMGELTGQLHLTRSIKVLPSPSSVFQTIKSKRPCQVTPEVTSIDIPATVMLKPEKTASALLSPVQAAPSPVEL